MGAPTDGQDPLDEDGSPFPKNKYKKVAMGMGMDLENPMDNGGHHLTRVQNSSNGNLNINLQNVAVIDSNQQSMMNNRDNDSRLETQQSQGSPELENQQAINKNNSFNNRMDNRMSNEAGPGMQRTMNGAKSMSAMGSSFRRGKHFGNLRNATVSQA